VSEPKFTAGPWEVDASGYRAPGGGLCVMAGDLCVAVVQGDSEKPQEANACVIAAATELLEALQMYLVEVPIDEVCDYAEQCKSKARAALAKALGEPT
jgi:hypothetical protein